MTIDPAGTTPKVPQVVLHQQHLNVGTQPVAIERVVLRRRITSRVRQVEVTVRREELEITREPLAGAAAASHAPPRSPLVLVLSEEVPVVQLETRAYERVTVHLDRQLEQQQVTEDLSHEKAELLTDTTGPASATATPS